MRDPQFLDALRKACLRSQLVKFPFGASEVKVLNHIISFEGVRPGPEKINAVVIFPSPSSLGKPSEQLKCISSF